MKVVREHYECRFCGLEIIADRDTLEIMHEAPECADFSQVVGAAGGSDGTPVVVDDESLSNILYTFLGE